VLVNDAGLLIAVNLKPPFRLAAAIGFRAYRSRQYIEEIVGVALFFAPMHRRFPRAPCCVWMGLEVNRALADVVN